MERLKTKVLVVGGGPGGYVAAIRAGQLGLDTVLVEADRLGGVCLTRGCIPSKALIHVAEHFAAVRRAQSGHHGVRVEGGEVRFEMREAVAWKDTIVDRLSQGVASLLKRANVKVVEGWATFVDAKTCTVAREGAEPLTITAENVILATGSAPAALPGLPWGPHVVSSTEVLAFEALPDRLVVVGGGYIGLELGAALRKLGAQVTIVEAQDRLLPQYDAALTAPVEKALARDGVTVHLAARAVGYSGGRLKVAPRIGDPFDVVADKVLVTVGRTPRTQGWGLEAMGLDLVDGFVKADAECRTAMRGVWAIGDLVGEPMLAHKASAQGEMVAEIIAGARRRFSPAAIPAVCFTDPEVVVVGVCGGEGTTTTVFPLAANGRALTLEVGDDGGFVQVTARADDNRILGFAGVGRQMAELSGEMVALIEMGAVLEDVAGVIHAHPTLSETLGEVSHRALGHAIHL